MHRQLRTLWGLVAVVMLVACGDGDSPAGPPPEEVEPPPALTAGTWALSLADGQTLPAMIAHRTLADGTLEQTYVDSSRLTIAGDGRYEQRAWLRTLRNGALHVRRSFEDAGRWSVDGDRYRFASIGEIRTSTVRNREEGRLDVIERLVLERDDAGLVAAVYVPWVDVDASPVGQWSARTLGDDALPATVIVIPDDPAPPGASRSVLEAGGVELRADGSYRRTHVFSRWMTDDLAGGAPWSKTQTSPQSDFGTWTREGTLVTLRSGWLQNYTVRGTFSRESGLRLRFPIDADDPPYFDVGYARQR